ncbi:MAG: neuraminidase-like domain-containing protein, partial [Myxococcota bacterium]
APLAHAALQLAAKLAYLVKVFELDAGTFTSWVLDAPLTGAPPLQLLPLTPAPSDLDTLWARLEPTLAWLKLDRLVAGTAEVAPDVRATLRAGRVRTALQQLADAAGLDRAVLPSWLLQLQAPGALDPVRVELTVLDPTLSPLVVTVNGQTVSVSGTDEHTLLSNWKAAAATPPGQVGDPDLTYLTVAEQLDSSNNFVALRLTTSDPAQVPLDVSGPNVAVTANLLDTGLFWRLLEGWLVLSKLGVDISTALRWVTADPSPTDAAEVRQLAKSRAVSEDAWHTEGRRLRDDIRGRQQTALFSAVRTMTGQPTDDSEFYSKYLIDAKMDPCMLTSRLKLAISATQTYVNQMLLGQVTETATGEVLGMDSTDEQDWRSWRGSYRMWEAARKVFLFPENWLKPSLRVERSEEYREFESKIAIQGLDHQTAERAFSDYFVSIMKYANPLHACVTQDEHGNVHLFARAGDDIDALIYRRGEPLSALRIDGATKFRWSAWESVPFPVPGGRDRQKTVMAAIVEGDELILSWLVASIRKDDSGSYLDTEVWFATRTRGVWSKPSAHRDLPPPGYGQTRLSFVEYRLIRVDNPQTDFPYALSSSAQHLQPGVYAFIATSI